MEDKTRCPAFKTYVTPTQILVYNEFVPRAMGTLDAERRETRYWDVDSALLCVEEWGDDALDWRETIVLEGRDAVGETYWTVRTVELEGVAIYLRELVEARLCNDPERREIPVPLRIGPTGRVRKERTNVR